MNTATMVTGIAHATADSQPDSDTREHRLGAAGLSIGLHVLIGALLLASWSAGEPPAAPHFNTISMQLLALPPPAPAVAPPPPVELAPPEPKPAMQQPSPEEAALALRRIEQEEHARELQAQQQRREQLERQQREREIEQRETREREAQEARKLAQQREAERQQQARIAAQAAAEAEQAAAASRQYLPIAKEAPAYPQRALDTALEGDCTVSYTVNPQGRVENPAVVGECHPLFIRPSLAAARSFRYQPRIINGRAVPVPEVTNTFHYRIK